METLNRRISVVEPVGPAIEQVKQILFKPFDLGKWFIIGFCAWLAGLGHRYGGFNIGSFDKSEIPPEVVQFCKTHIILIGSIAFTVILISVVFFVLFCWLSSRGKFMFLDCLVKNKAEIAEPWKNFKEQANSLFQFRLVLLISTIAVILPFVGLNLYSAYLIDNMITKIIILTAGLSGAVLTVMTAATVKALTYDFVMPIMYINKINTMAAWKKFWPVFWQNFWKISLLYFLFKLVLAMAIVILVIFIFCAGCCFCCVSNIVFIPYIGTVIMLPVSSFFRLYPLFYFRQYGAEFDVFAANL